MANTRGNAHEAQQGSDSWVSDSAPKDTPSVALQTARSDAWAQADEARAHANDLARQATEAKAKADELEAKASAGDEEVAYEPVDASAGTWEASVAAPAAGDSDSAADQVGGEEDEQA